MLLPRVIQQLFFNVVNIKYFPFISILIAEISLVSLDGTQIDKNSIISKIDESSFVLLSNWFISKTSPKIDEIINESLH